MTSILARLRDLEAKATPGPWKADMLWRYPEDSTLIAESRNHLAALLDIAEAASELGDLPALPPAAIGRLRSALARLEAAGQ